LRDLTYRQNGNYHIPNLILDEPIDPPIGKHGRLRRDFLMKHHTILYNELILTGRLCASLSEIDSAAEACLDTDIPQLVQDANITEALKAQNPLEWVKRMNAINVQAEEIIWSELIYNQEYGGAKNGKRSFDF